MKQGLAFLAVLAATSVFCLAQSQTDKQTIHGTWKVGNWSACVGGIQTRSVVCVGPMHEAIQPGFCPSPTPVNEMKCAEPKGPPPNNNNNNNNTNHPPKR